MRNRIYKDKSIKFESKSYSCLLYTSLLIAVMEEGDSYGVKFLNMLGIKANHVAEEINQALKMCIRDSPKGGSLSHT